MTIDIEKLADEYGAYIATEAQGETPFMVRGEMIFDAESLYKFAEAYAAKVLEDKEREIVELQDWKKQAIDVENEWDEQAVGKALNVQLGQSIRRSILPKIIELQAHIKDLMDTNNELRKYSVMQLGHIYDLREALEEISIEAYKDQSDLNIIRKVIELSKEALSKTPAQNLQEHDDEVIEMCAEELEERGCRFESEVIRALKTNS